MNIRRFQNDDAETCFRLRSNAFIQKFYGELTPQEVAAAVNAYMPNDFIDMSKIMPFFTVEQNNSPIGFFNLKRKDEKTAELPMIYIDLHNIGKGIGTACIDYIEKWLSLNWKEIRSLIVDTVIPIYNSGFYKKIGFIPNEDVFCKFSGIKVKALRLVKKLQD
jgi:GNAT superfamily N-acetyltransferase